MPEPLPPPPPPFHLPPPRPDWQHLHLWQIQPIRDASVIAAAIGLVYLGSRLSIVTVPILVALLLAYLFEPLVGRITRSRWVTRRGAAVAIIIMLALVVVLPVSIGATFAVYQGVRFVTATANRVEVVMASVVKPEDQELRERVPRGAWSKIRDFIVEQESIRKKLSPPTTPEGTPPPTPNPPTATQPEEGPPEPAAENSDTYRLVQLLISSARANAADINKRLVAAGTGILGGALGLIEHIGKLLFGALLTAFFFFFFCTGWERVLTFGHGLIPDERKSRVLDLVRKMDRVIAGFVRGRLTVAACMMLLYTLGYWLIGTPAPLILGPAIGAMVIIPYMTTMATPIVILLMWLDPPGGWQSEWWWIIGGPILVVICNQFLDDYLLNPRIQGKRTNMDIPTILFASIAGGALAGFYGLLVAIPTAACVKILLNEVFWPRFRAWSRGQAPDLLPIRKD